MFKENLEALATRLGDLIASKSVVGEAMVIDDVTIVPIMTVSMGFGLGGGEGDDAKGSKGVGSGAGAGLKVAPTVILVVKDGNVEIHSLTGKGSLSKVFEMVPGLIEKFCAKRVECCSPESKE